MKRQASGATGRQVTQHRKMQTAVQASQSADSISPSPSYEGHEGDDLHQELHSLPNEERRRELRRLRNRESARRVRCRRVQEFSTLEQQLQQYRLDNLTLQTQNAQLQGHLAALIDRGAEVSAKYDAVTAENLQLKTELQALKLLQDPVVLAALAQCTGTKPPASAAKLQLNAVAPPLVLGSSQPPTQMTSHILPVGFEQHALDLMAFGLSRASSDGATLHSQRGTSDAALSAGTTDTFLPNDAQDVRALGAKRHIADQKPSVATQLQKAVPENPTAGAPTATCSEIDFLLLRAKARKQSRQQNTSLESTMSCSETIPMTTLPGIQASPYALHPSYTPCAPQLQHAEACPAAVSHPHLDNLSARLCVANHQPDAMNLANWRGTTVVKMTPPAGDTYAPEYTSINKPGFCPPHVPLPGMSMPGSWQDIGLFADMDFMGMEMTGVLPSLSPASSVPLPYGATISDDQGGHAVMH